MTQVQKWKDYHNKVRQGKPDDEYYTLYEDVELMLNEFDLRDKIIYCPCDTDESAFIRYFKTTNNCRELIYTSDDFRNHEDLFNKADVVVTNPPFTQYVDFWRFIKKHYILITPLLPTIKVEYERVRDNKFYRGVSRFDRSDGTKARVSCQWISDLSTKQHPNGYSFKDLFNRDIPILDNPTPLRTTKTIVSKRQRDLLDFELPEYINVYSKKTGYPKNEKIFCITANTLCSDFVYHSILNKCGIGTCIVSLRSINNE